MLFLLLSIAIVAALVLLTLAVIDGERQIAANEAAERRAYQEAAERLASLEARINRMKR